MTLKSRYMRIFALFSMVVVMGLQTGCLTLFKSKPKTADPDLGMMSIHTYHPPGTIDADTMTLYHYSGKPIVLGASPLINSNYFEQVIPFETEDGWGVRVLLTTRGSNAWAKVTSQYYGRSLVLVIDGAFRALIEVPRPSDKGAFELSGPFTKDEAQRIADYVTKHKG